MSEFLFRPGDGRVATARARARACAALAGTPFESLRDDVELVVSELVTNTLLHTPGGGRLVVAVDAERVRVEVHDEARVPPQLSVGGSDAMIGRGLHLVQALSSRWGVEATPSGKCVWAEFGLDQPAEPLSADDLLAMWADDDAPAPEPTYHVELGEVPTPLLVAAKAHVDNLVREFTLVTTGAASGTASPVPPPLTALIEAVVDGFAGARNAIKRQATAAAARGEPRVRLELDLPASAAAAGEAYLRALDQADAYCRANRLLTLETPPQHRIFRRWYVEELLHQLRRAAAGLPAEPPQTFEERLLAEVARGSAARSASERAARLHALSVALTAAETPADVGRAVLTEGSAALGASGGAMLALDEDGVLRVLAGAGDDGAAVERLVADPGELDLPGAAVLRSGQPVWLETRGDTERLFPELARDEPGTRALCAVPLLLHARALGALRFSFAADELFDDDVRSYVLTIAAVCAQALGRAQTLRAERDARRSAERTAYRLLFLQGLSGELTRVRSSAEAAEVIVRRSLERLGAHRAVVWRLADEGDTLQVQRAGTGTGPVEVSVEPVPLGSRLPVADAVRTGAPVLYRPAERGRYRELGRRLPADVVVLLALPLTVEGRAVGALSLAFDHDRDFDPEELSFLQSLADQCAQAIDRARAAEAQQRALASLREASERLRFLAAASAELSSTLDVETTMSNIARLAVPAIGDWCSVQVVDGQHLRTLAVEHVDPAKVALARELQERYPADPDAPVGAAHVVRTGQAQLLAEIADDLLQAVVRDQAQLELMRTLGLRSAMVVPLLARGRALGAITFIAAESGRVFDRSDLALAEELGRRAGVAFENARLYHHQVEASRALQRTLLPPRLPEAEQVRFGAVYQPVSGAIEVGGDFYDIWRTGSGAWAFAIGDVCGTGPAAAGVTSLVRNTLRALTMSLDDPAQALEQLNAAMLAAEASGPGGERFCTAVLGVLHPRPDGATVTVASGGHPGPVLRHTDGAVSEIELDGLLLGVLPDAMVTSRRVELRPGELLALVTDGVLEARNADGELFGVDRLQAALRTATAPQPAADAIGAAALAFAGGRIDDDLAALVVCVPAEPPAR